jgi:hypothetical protein
MTRLVRRRECRLFFPSQERSDAIEQDETDVVCFVDFF